MDLNDLSIFSMMTRRMSWLTKRQSVLAHNIANSDTPGYRPYDLKPQNFSNFFRPQVRTTEIVTTHGKHLDPIRRSTGFRNEKVRDTYEVAPAGNAVVIEEQLMKVVEIQGGYRLATNLYQKHVKMIKTALGRNGR